MQARLFRTWPGRVSWLLVGLSGAFGLSPIHALAAPFPLVKAGQPVGTIVLATQASENARAAAAELQSYVRKMTGVELRIADDSSAPSGPLILVGPSRLTDQIPALHIPYGVTRELREEGFVIE